MCLILLAFQSHPRYPLVIAANRDEFHDRQTRAAHWWEDDDILAGRDMEAGGTWFGVNRQGAFAAVTNYRDPSVSEPGSPSRGELPVWALRQGMPDEATLSSLVATGSQYNGFNLLLGSRDQVYYLSNRAARYSLLSPGVYGLSNHLLDTPWPKVERGKASLSTYLGSVDVLEHHRLLALLADRERPSDAELPDTGIGEEWERLLAPAFIVSRRYGTRASTVLTIDDQGTVSFTERTYNWRGEAEGERAFSFALP